VLRQGKLMAPHAAPLRLLPWQFFVVDGTAKKWRLSNQTWNQLQPAPVFTSCLSLPPGKNVNKACFDTRYDRNDSGKAARIFKCSSWQHTSILLSYISS